MASTAIGGFGAACNMPRTVPVVREPSSNCVSTAMAIYSDKFAEQ
ncbi:MAG: hypothetical protein OEW90_10545 [Betaproteobacteria bacterium]|nr:hypothetical protein [Betaproteobacteria bacterium]MDH4324566.1 hypothetical protein [Betaproteobacteria bacterium]